MIPEPTTAEANIVRSTILLDIGEAAEVLGLTIWRVRALISAGELPRIKIGNKFFLRRQALSRWAEQKERKVRL